MQLKVIDAGKTSTVYVVCRTGHKLLPPQCREIGHGTNLKLQKYTFSVLFFFQKMVCLILDSVFPRILWIHLFLFDVIIKAKDVTDRLMTYYCGSNAASRQVVVPNDIISPKSCWFHTNQNKAKHSLGVVCLSSEGATVELVVELAINVASCPRWLTLPNHITSMWHISPV